ncbi:hypothetical protein PR048_016927, partial [Dryococelus australis]
MCRVPDIEITCVRECHHGRLLITSQHKRHNPSARNKKKRSISNEYSVCIEGKTTSVCKQALAINYMGELLLDHEIRGKRHSRLNRMSENAKQPVTNRVIQRVPFSTFREIFVTESELHFGHPRLYTYKTYDKLAVLIESETDEDAKLQAKHDKSVHLCRAEAAQRCMKSDFSLSKADQDLFTKQALPTLHIQTSVVIYSRQSWSCNRGLYDINRGPVHIWFEDVASRGYRDLASRLMTYLRSYKESIKYRKALVALSDSCGDQNRNKKTSNVKCSIPGRAFLNCDRNFRIIEKTKRIMPAVHLPEQWIQLTKQQSGTNCFGFINEERDVLFIGSCGIFPIYTRLAELKYLHSRQNISLSTLKGKILNGKKSTLLDVGRYELCRNFLCSTMQEEHFLGSTQAHIP